MAVLPRGTCIRQGFVVTCVEFRPSIITCCLYSQMIHFAPLNLSVFEYLNISMSLDFFPTVITAYPCGHAAGGKKPTGLYQAPHSTGVASPLIFLSAQSVGPCLLSSLVYSISTDLLGFIQRPPSPFPTENLLPSPLADIFSTPSSELLWYLPFSSCASVILYYCSLLSMSFM